MNRIFEVGSVVVAEFVGLLEGNDKGPTLELGKEYTVKGEVFDSKGNQHLDVGLPSPFEFIRSWETKEELPNGDTIQWCHPSRFKLKA